MSLKSYLHSLLAGKDLTELNINDIISQIVDESTSQVEIAGLLSLWAAKHETHAEITALVNNIRTHLPVYQLPETLITRSVIDLVGTGGDGKNTLNISTAAAIVTASCGVPVAKHGNNSSSSQCGSADVLTEWGIKYQGTPEQAMECLQQCGICFCYARQGNPVMTRLAPIRKKLGIRTCFNVIGPLLNPVPLQTILVGVYDPCWLQPMAEILQGLGITRGMVVHSVGMDEATTVGDTEYCEIHPDYPQPKLGKFSPIQFGFSTGKSSHLGGGLPAYNSRQLQDVLQESLTHNGNRTIRETIALNAGLAIYLAGGVESIQDGCAQAWKAIDSGLAYQKLVEWRQVSTVIYNY